MAEFSIFKQDQPIELKIVFKSRDEAMELYDELRNHINGDWSYLALDFFTALLGAAQKPNLR